MVYTEKRLRFLHLTEIERRIALLRPDTILLGLGPSAYLLDGIDRELLKGVRLWGVNDIFRILPVDDLVLMDPPVNALHPLTDRCQFILESFPERLWIYDGGGVGKPAFPEWQEILPPDLAKACRPFRATCLDPQLWQFKVIFKTEKNGEPSTEWQIEVDQDPFATCAISPTGMVPLAWREGARRIGVIGVDMIPRLHVSSLCHDPVSWYFQEMARSIRERGGEIGNLSPVSAILTMDKREAVNA